jgi:hypothetical protein
LVVEWWACACVCCLLRIVRCPLYLIHLRYHKLSFAGMCKHACQDRSLCSKSLLNRNIPSTSLGIVVSSPSPRASASIVVEPISDLPARPPTSFLPQQHHHSLLPSSPPRPPARTLTRVTSKRKTFCDNNFAVTCSLPCHAASTPPPPPNNHHTYTHLSISKQASCLAGTLLLLVSHWRPRIMFATPANTRRSVLRRRWLPSRQRHRRQRCLGS